MSAAIEYPTRIPYGGGYRILDPLTGIWNFGSDFQMLCDNIYKSRRANSVPIGVGIEQEIEQWVCQQYPQECVNLDPTMPRKRSLTLTDIINGSRVMLSQWWNGRKVVDRTEAERRAQICIKCPFNVAFAKPCTGICPELVDVVKAITGAQGTQYDVQLKSCGVCGCFLQAAIWVEVETQLAPLDPVVREQFKSVQGCWKVTQTI